MKHRLPSLNALAAFEAAGRLGGFTRAAEELSISQPAVTRHIRGLEADLGAPLFIRAHNKVSLSDPGLRLWHSVNRCLSDVADVVQAIREDTEAPPLGFATHSGFGQQWLMPRIESLRTALGGRPINLSIMDGDRELNQGNFDCAIRHGGGRWPGQQSVRLMDEVVVPIVSPRYLEAHPDLARATAEDFVTQPLIHMDEGDRPWMTWSVWFRHCGIRLPVRQMPIRFNHYPLVVQEVLAGTGVGLGWRPLVDSMLETGALVAVGPQVTSLESGWWLTWPNGSADPDRDRVLTWLRGEIAPAGTI
ncbi:MAG: LysR substrate-binding domain-containing protein [Alphaproteobacteria bacterium]|nr:LysR substrate-binding domain-containing protein [Alphaproteobacteria bacterium]